MGLLFVAPVKNFIEAENACYTSKPRKKHIDYEFYQFNGYFFEEQSPKNGKNPTG